MKRLPLVLTCLFIASPALAQDAPVSHRQELYDVCANSGDASATPGYCGCSADILAALPEQQQMLLLAISNLHVAGNLNEQTIKDVQTSMGLDDAAFQALFLEATNAGSQADAACIGQ
ncbi:MAG TPA: hypothetical protein PL096_12240 [Micropepsaceae bacterium]|nr:hypothetical protein [Micropepsaceae bacterium]